MEGIKLKLNGDYTSIAEPSGTKITASKLESGKTYIHKNLHFLRTIISIDEQQVFYKDEFGFGRCSRSHFVQICPHEATLEEINFLLKKRNHF